jgi:3-isopropylmalate/(R)-2-methylmalate dehydratase small subunit
VKAFRSVTARAAVLDRPDVDTDQIIPKQFLKRIERTGYGEFLFFDWRQDPDFELNRSGCQGARILLAGSNFGCGSSREHAAWALQDYGFDVVVAPSFGDIFFSNAVQVGLVPIALPADDVKKLMAVAGDDDELTVDLEQQTISAANGEVVAFTMDPFVRESLLRGLDPIGRTLAHEDDIAAFEARSPAPVSTAALAR